MPVRCPGVAFGEHGIFLIQVWHGPWGRDALRLSVPSAKMDQALPWMVLLLSINGF